MNNKNADSNQQTRLYLLMRWLRKAQTLAHFSSHFDALVPLPHLLQNGIKNSLQFYDIVRDLRGVKMVVDSSKDIHKAVSIYQRALERTRIILLTRDGRGVFFSRLYSGVPTSETPKRAIKHWRNYHLQTLPLLDRYVDPAHQMFVKFKGLATETEKAVNGIYSWLQLSQRYCQSAAPSQNLHIAGGNDSIKLRFSGGVKLDERWRGGLNECELKLFENTAGELNRTLG